MLRQISLLFTLMWTTPLLSKSVLLLDIVNYNQSENYAYLENTITESIRNSLKSRFIFSEPKREETQNIAQSNNFIHKNEYYTKTIGLQLGLLVNTDIVIGGRYSVESKNLTVELYLYDIGKREVLEEMKFNAKVNNRIFQVIDKIAGEVADKLQTVLPNRDGSYKISYHNRSIGLYHSFYILGGLTQNLSQIGQKDLDASSNLNLNYYTSTFQFGVEYHPHIFRYRSVEPLLLLKSQFGSETFKAKASGEGIPATLLAIELGPGAQFPIYKNRQYRFLVYGGPMLSFYVLDFDYQNLAVEPLSTSGESITSQSQTQLAAGYFAGLRFEYLFTKYIVGVFGSGIKQSFFSDHAPVLADFNLGMAVKF